MKKKWFISAITPKKQVGIMQFEATEAEYKNIAERLCPVRAEFRAYQIEEFEDGLPIGQFVDAASAKLLGY